MKDPVFHELQISEVEMQGDFQKYRYLLTHRKLQ
ncbi:MAG: hypothetical protein ACI86M_003863 [Saprospiraceae bacterium]|jgi:hypothetical protein